MNLIQELNRVAESVTTAVETAPIVGEVLRGTAGPSAYAMFMAQTYHYVLVTAPNLLLAARALQQQQRHPELVALYLDKAVEEAGHDVWAVDDAAVLGVSKRVFAAPSPAVLAYKAWNRFTIETGLPVAYFGTAYVLEHLGAKAAPRAVENLLRSGAIPEGALRFLRGHGEADQGHIAELGAALERVSDPTEKEAILLSAQVTAALYPRFFIVPGAS